MAIAYFVLWDPTNNTGMINELIKQINQSPSLGGTGSVSVNSTPGYTGLTFAGAGVSVSGAAPGATVTIPGGGGGLTISSTPIAGGVSGEVLYDNAGVLGNLTPTQLTAIINAFSSSLAGTAPASGGGTINFLRADGAWAVPPGGGGAGGTVVFDNLAAIQGATIPNTVESIVSLAYATSGDLRGDVMVFHRVAALPTYPGFVRSTDRFLPNGSTDATNGGYWQLAMNEVNVFMFGALGIGNSSNDDWPAIQAALGYCNNRINTVPSGQDNSIVTLKFPNCNGYYSSQTIPITSTMRVVGYGWGGGYHSAIPIQFPIGVTGMTIVGTAIFSQIRGISVHGVLDKPLANPIAHGFSISTTVSMEDCCATAFSGCGFLINGSTPLSTDLSRFKYCTAETNGRSGFYTFGTDSQVSMYDLCNAVSNGGHGFFDSAEFGNKYDTCHAAGNGTVTTQGVVSDSLGSIVAFGGHPYLAVPQSPGTASFVGTPPTSTTTPGTNSAVWYPIGGSTAGYPTWVLNNIYREGGDWCSYFGTPQFINCYTEGAPNCSWLSSSPWFGPTPPQTAFDTSGIINSDTVSTNGIHGSWGTFYTAQNGSTVGTESISISHGVGHTPPTNNIRFIDAHTSSGYYNEYLLSGDWITEIGFGGTGGGYRLTGSATARTFGSSAIQPAVTSFDRLGLENGGGGQVIDSGSSPPGSGVAAVGWIRINQFPNGLGGIWGWVCTTGGTNGSTSVWTPLTYNLPPSTVANLPGAGTQGRRGMVTNSNATLAAGLGNTVVGGGANIVPVYDDGTNWKIG